MSTETKLRPVKLTAMEKAAIAMFDAGAYDCGGNDRWVFAGRYETGCAQLVNAEFCNNHPKGLIVFSQVRGTLTSKGETVGRQMYRLNDAGRRFAEKAKKRVPQV